MSSTTTTFRKHFNNNKSSLIRFGKGPEGIPSERLYAKFFSDDHQGLIDVLIITDKTDVENLTECIGVWAL